MPKPIQSRIDSLNVCVDIGGTFTDCLAVWNEHYPENVSGGEQRLGCVKVLSSGMMRCNVTGVEDSGQVKLELPEEWTPGTSGEHSTRVDPAMSLPQDFFRSAILSRVEDGISHRVGLIAAFAPVDNTVSLSDIDADSWSQLNAGDIVEIDCGMEAPVLATHLLLRISLTDPLPELDVQLGTTRGTNALLTRSGACVALVTTAGFGDLLNIGTQARPELFDLAFQKQPPLAEHVVETSGRLNSDGTEHTSLDENAIANAFDSLRSAGVDAIAIAMLHAYKNAEHEIIVERLAREAGFADVSRSSEVAPLINLVSRGETTTLDAYLNPVLSTYLKRVRRQFGGDRCRMHVMSSGGNLVPASEFRGRDSVLSGPAGGVVGLQAVARQNDCRYAIGLDMGGTSTDVSRYDGQVARRYETHLAGIRVMAPMMEIHTVAAGGGSICDCVGGRLMVGPTSAGAMPGPACYGRGGPLTITDVNVLLGRIMVDRFPIPLLIEASRERLRRVVDRMDQPPAELETLAEGFVDIAVTHMAEAVRAITTAKGVDLREHALVGFGGAAAQHLCRIANALGIQTVIDHPRGSVLSAVGMGVATVGHILTKGVYQDVGDINADQLQRWLHQLGQQTIDHLCEGVEYHEPSQSVSTAFQWDCRYRGTESAITLTMNVSSDQSWNDVLARLPSRFHDVHQQRYGYHRADRAIEVVCLRCEATLPGSNASKLLSAPPASSGQPSGQPSGFVETKVWSGGKWQSFQRWERATLTAGQAISAGSVIVSDQSTLIVEPGWGGEVRDDGTICLQRKPDDHQPSAVSEENDAVAMEVVARRLQSIADAMGEVLRRTAISVNVKERLDFSCAVFDSEGELIANAPHVPVHLGAMGHTVRHMAKVYPAMFPGDCYVSNDPYHGGSHLPDVTVVTPVFCEHESHQPTFFVASRAHHAEIGGMTPGSMPPMARTLDQEGVLIRDFALIRDGVSFENEIKKLLSSGTYPSRNVEENLADLRGQIAAGQEGVRAIKQMQHELTLPMVNRLTSRLLDVAEQSVGRWISTLPTEPLIFRDRLDDGTVIAVRLQRTGDDEHPRLTVDFAGTADVHPNGFNATLAIVSSAVLYVLRCFCDSNLPLCEGVLRRIDLELPTGLLSPPADPDPAKCPAVVAGNVETSQRVVDVLLGAIGQSETERAGFRGIAASQGTMNNVLMGDTGFGYYETIGGGSGATVFGRGADGVHTHMTNTRITDAEVIESRLPIRLIQFSIREGSGGGGKHRGGNGLIREFEFLKPLTVSLITSRRTTQPYGVAGGLPGASGVNTLIGSDGQVTVLPSCITIEVEAGDRLRIETPGGGGWGAA